MELINPFTREGRWYKANLHTHTTASDGKVTVAERIEQYRRRGYQVLALTDHGVTHAVEKLSSRGFLVVGGREFHPPCRKEGTKHHFVALGVPHGFEFSRRSSPNRCIRDVREAGGAVLLAHPFWTGLDWGTIGGLRGLDAVEVYNSACRLIGREASENEWAYMLDHGLFLPAVAVDDTHGKEDFHVGAAWTWLKLPTLTVGHVLQAVRTGCGYASTGPVIHDFGVDRGEVRLRCSPVRSILFMTIPGCGASRWADPGRTITSFRASQRNWPYVRAVVTDAAGRKAWTNPLRLSRIAERPA